MNFLIDSKYYQILPDYSSSLDCFILDQAVLSKIKLDLTGLNQFEHVSLKLVLVRLALRRISGHLRGPLLDGHGVHCATAIKLFSSSLDLLEITLERLCMGSLRGLV
jgi:hypothetical protein